MGRHENAARANEEAVGLLPTLVDTVPNINQCVAWLSLEYLGENLAKMPLHEDAARTHEEAASLYRNLAETDPTVDKYFARSLRSLGIDLRNIGRQEDGARADEEADKLLVT